MIPIDIRLFPHWCITTPAAWNKHFKEILYPIWHIDLFISPKRIPSELSSHLQPSFKDQRKLFLITDLHI